MGPDEIPEEPQHGDYDDDLPDTSLLEPDYEAEERDEVEVEEELEPIPSDQGGL